MRVSYSLIYTTYQWGSTLCLKTILGVEKALWIQSKKYLLYEPNGHEPRWNYELGRLFVVEVPTEYKRKVVKGRGGSRPEYERVDTTVFLKGCTEIRIVLCRNPKTCVPRGSSSSWYHLKQHTGRGPCTRPRVCMSCLRNSWFTVVASRWESNRVQTPAPVRHLLGPTNRPWQTTSKESLLIESTGRAEFPNVFSVFSLISIT